MKGGNRKGVTWVSKFWFQVPFSIFFEMMFVWMN